MREHIIFIYIFIVILFLTGCSRSATETLTITMSLGEEEWKVFRKYIFPPFEKRYDVKIRPYQIESAQLATKLEALQSAGSKEIDLFAQDNMNLAILVDKGLVLDLSDYESQIPEEVMGNLIESCKFNKRLMFMPFRPNVQIVYFNERAFRKYGLIPPKDWDELLEIARIFKEKEKTGRVLLKGFGGKPTATQVYEFILQAGGNPYSFNDSGCIRAFEFLQRIGPYLSIETRRAKWNTVNDILAREEAYLGQNWPFGVVILVKRYGLKFIKTYNGWRGPAGEFHVIGGDVFGIPRTCKNKRLALKFISYMQTKQVQSILVSKLAWPSIREDVYTEVEGWQKEYFESVKKALKRGVFRKNVLWWPVYEKYISEAFREIVLEGAPVKETLNKYKMKLDDEKISF